MSRLILLALVLLSVKTLAGKLMFQELTVIRHEPAKVDDLTSTESEVPPQTLFADSITAVAPESVTRTVSGAEHWKRKDSFYTILLAGVDNHNGGSDTIILLSMDAKNGRVFGLSVPRDTKAVIDGVPYKINAAYKIGGTSLLADTLSYQMSIPIDYTVEVNLNAFAALVDAIGGVDFDVPLDMDYEDPAQNLEIHVSKGPQHLNGETALKVVRFRHNSDGTGYGNEDLGRIQTQQRFIKAAAKKLISFSSLTKLDDFARIFQKYVKTDLTLPNLAWLARRGLSIGLDGIEFATLPGTWKNPYIYPDREQALALINEHLNPYEEDLTLEGLHFPD